jgi:N-acetylglucosaminyldiphosphoundecaprenol N-acetyl-beta-D-mannosaminyltransferase
MKVDFLGIPVCGFTKDEIVDWVISHAKGTDRSVVYGINAHSVNTAFKSREYWNALQRSDVVYCDGISVLWGCKLLGTPIPEKLTTTDFFYPVLQRAEKDGLSMYILGGEPGLAEQAAEKIRGNYPDLEIKGTHSGYFSPEEERQVISEIRNLCPNMLWVGMGNPLQELWVEKHLNDLQVPVCLTCGGMMKIVSGNLSRPPQWVTQAGFEWAYRLVTHPRYTWRRYLIGNVLFLYRLFRRWLTGVSPRPHDTTH